MLVRGDRREDGYQEPGHAIALVHRYAGARLAVLEHVYALHYAHMFYLKGEAAGRMPAGSTFPSTKEPDYWDFIYFSFTLGMTFQTSDIDITSRAIRRVSIGQCLAAFVFNLGMLAFTINIDRGAALNLVCRCPRTAPLTETGRLPPR